jgi:hypothetical protein
VFLPEKALFSCRVRKLSKATTNSIEHSYMHCGHITIAPQIVDDKHPP